MSTETVPMKSEAGWPIFHLNAGTAGCKQLKPAPGKDRSHYITGFYMSGGGDSNGFYLLRRNCIQFTTTDTWTITDGGAILDIGNEAADGHFALEVLMMIPTASAATNILTRGNPATTGYTFEVTSGGLLKFTIKDGTTAVTGTGTHPVNDGKWHSLAVVCERDSATGLRLLIDGVREVLTAGSADTTAMNDAINPAGTAVQTGTSNKTHYLGALGMYIGASAALSDATILANWNEGIGRKYGGGETGLALAFNNDEGIGTANHDVLNNAGYVVTTSGTEWVPTKRNGPTAAIEIAGPPIDKDDDDMTAMGEFITGKLNTQGFQNPSVFTFPQAIKIGRNNPVRILETDGAFDLILFGYTDHF